MAMWGRPPSAVQAEQSSAGLPRPKPQSYSTRKKLQTKIYSRDDLRPGKPYPGPAIITEYSATTVIPPNANFHLDRAANLVISLH